MDLTSAITGLSAAKTQSAVQMKVARKILDNQEMEGAAAIKLIQAAGNVGNKAGDDLVAAATGLGGNVDAYG